MACGVRPAPTNALFTRALYARAVGAEEVPIGLPWINKFAFWPRRDPVSRKWFWWRWIWLRAIYQEWEFDLTKIGPYHVHEVRAGKWCPTPRGHTP